MTAYTSTNFWVRLIQEKDQVLLTQQILNPVINTKNLSGTIDIINREVPSLFQNECFNPNNLPFSEEVKATEVGHLFEHLILEFLKIEVEKLYGSADFSGVTSWNWTENKFGCFSIKINSALKYRPLFNRALKQAIRVLELIFADQSPSIQLEAGMLFPTSAD